MATSNSGWIALAMSSLLVPGMAVAQIFGRPGPPPPIIRGPPPAGVLPPSTPVPTPPAYPTGGVPLGMYPHAQPPSVGSVPQAVIGPPQPVVQAESQAAPPVAGGTSLPDVATLAPDVYFEDVVGVGDDARFTCSGSLIAVRWVLTARHCLPAARVLFGNRFERPRALRSVLRAVEPDDETTDVALLEIDEGVPDVVPRGLRLADESGVPRGIILLVGFGAIDPSGRLGLGQKRLANAWADGWGCTVRLSALFGCDPAAELVLTQPSGHDTCDGDSGGPALESVGDTFRIVGVTSRPTANARARCGQGGVYTRVDRLTAWIARTVGDSNQEPAP